MSITLDFVCCGPLSESLSAQIMGLIKVDELSPVSLAQAALLDCTACRRTNSACLSSLCEPIRLCSLLPEALRLKPDSAELVTHKLESDGLWLSLSVLAKEMPLTVAPLVASTVNVPEVTLAKAQNWSVIMNLAQAGVLKTDLTREIQLWQPIGLKESEAKRELLNYFAWLRGCKGVSSVLLEKAARRALRKLPNEIVEFILSFAGLLILD